MSNLLRLHHEVDILSPELQRTVAKLSECASVLPAAAAASASDIVQSFSTVYNTVCMILAFPPVNASNLIVTAELFGGATGLPYAQYAQIDPDTIHEFTSRLAGVWNALDVRNFEDGASWTPRMVASHQCRMLLDEGLLDRLETLAEVLTATFRPSLQ